MDNSTEATTVKKFFSRTTSIHKQINAQVDLVWKILIDGKEYTRWNSTITMFEGNIAKGQKIRLRSYLDHKRIFNLKVHEFVTSEKLVWGDAMGKRVFTLIPNDNGTLFSMTEKIGGPIFPLISKMIPPFDEAFEKFVKDFEEEVLNQKNRNDES